MALIQCKECGHMVSDRAKVCPKCGTPVNGDSYYDDCCEGEEHKKKKWWIWIVVVAAVCLLGGGGYYAYSKLGQKDDKTTSHASQQDEEVKEDIVEFTPEFIQAIGEYDELGVFSEGYAAARKGYKWGYINTKGDEVIPATIDALCVGRFSEGLALVAPDNAIEDGSFYVIDKTGKTVFKGKDLYIDACGENIRSEYLPYFIDGKMYVQIVDTNNGEFHYKYDVYDTNGKKINTVTLDVGENAYKKEQNSTYTIFSKENKVDGANSYTTYGLKDADGKVILPAIYDDINSIVEGKTSVGNGVVAVTLVEYGQNAAEGYSGSPDADTQYHHGYADLNGEDTFSDRVKRLSRESKERAMQQMAQSSEDDDYVISKDRIILDDERDNYNTTTASNGNLSWIQGNWKCYVDVFGVQKEYRVGISDEYITVFMAGEHYYTGPYRISGDMITYKDNYLLMDFDRHVIMADKSTDMHRF